MSRSLRRAIVGLLVAGLCPLLAAAPAHAMAPASFTGAHRADVQPAGRVPGGASLSVALTPTARLRVTLALAPRDAAALAREVHAVSDPSSVRYHRYLSVGQFARRFGASAVSRATVQRTLRQSGLAVSSVSANGLSLTASGTAAEIEAAFDTSLRRVRLPDGHFAYTDIATPTLPAAAAALVQGVSGLDSVPVSAPEGLSRAASAPHGPAVASMSARAAGAAGPSSCQAAARYGNSPQEIASAYGLNGLWTQGDVGTGTTVALFELEPYSSSDVAAYQSCYGTSATVTNIAVGSGASCQTGDSCGAEDELDIEDLAGLAPGATIDVYEGPNTTAGIYATYAAIVTADSAQVISTSWGACEANESTSGLSAENTLFQEAATQGQTMLAASGDSGANDCKSKTGARSVDDPASQPDVTGVGGTSLPSYLSPSAQTAWNDAAGAGGGGVSAKWARPSYQSAFAANGYAIKCPTSPTVPTLTTNCREVPDVSADADPETGYAIYFDGQWAEYGGTSLAAPTWAALVALADSSGYCTSRGVRIGFADPLLYGLPAADFTDVTTGNNTFDGVTGYGAQSGYDMVSGLGAPIGSRLVPALCGSSQTVTEPSATSPAPAAPAAPPVTTPTTTPPSAGSSAPAVRFAAPHRRRVKLGRRVRETLRAHDRRNLRLVYSAHHLPAGLRINRRTGKITGVARRAGHYTSSITATDTAGNRRTVVIRWTVFK